MGHEAKKRFGQNFLVDQNIIADIIRAIRPEAADNMVEIGPGLGALTRPLLKLLNTLHVVEIDRDIIARLKTDYPQDKIVINADLYGPPPPGVTPPNVNLNAVALFRTIKRLKLDVTQHVPIHGNPGPNADFERIVGPVAARTPAPGGGG